MSPDAIQYGNFGDLSIKIENGTFSWDKDSDHPTLKECEFQNLFSLILHYEVSAFIYVLTNYLFTN